MRKYRPKPVTTIKPSLLPWAAGLVLILVAGLISARLIQLAQTPIYVQKQQFFQHRVDQTLNRMMGHDHYLINVGVQLSEVKRELQRVHYTPRNITERIDQTFRFPVSEKDNQPAVIKAPDFDPQERLPGISPRPTKAPISVLPGFPIQKRGIVENREAQSHQTHIKQYFNENKETIVYPESIIDHLSVSVVLDQDRLKELNITTEDVSGVIRSTIGFLPERGDTIKIIAYPFKGWLYWVNQWGRLAISKARKAQHQIMVVLFVLVATGGGVMVGRWAWTRLKRYQVLKKHALNATRPEPSDRIDFQTKSQLDELALMAQRQPQAFITAINRWLADPEVKS